VTSSTPAGDLVTVRVIGAPVRLWAEASERHQELLREFALMQFGHAGGQQVPGRLLALSEELTGRYAGLMASNNSRRDDALAQGTDRIDLTYTVPAEVVDSCHRLLQLLDEVDAYCADDQLLTLATPPALRAFRLWFLGEFIDQISGADPVPWSGPLDCTLPAVSAS